MGLQAYQKKRKFDVTPEPRGRPARSKASRYVVQKHAARRLHYDLRLELDGVMKSWAVTKGPSLVPGDKRLAVHVEDHPVEYNTFEGTIPPGEYGGGTVLIWDRGRWQPQGDPHKMLKKGHLTFTIEGEKLRGSWHLIRMRGRPNETRENWLLIKAHDGWARSSKDPDILEEMPLSAVSGRSIEDIAQGKGKKRVWHSNRPVKENLKSALRPGNGGGAPQPDLARGPSRMPIRARGTTRKRNQRKDQNKSEAKGKAKRSKAKGKGKESAAAGAVLPEFVPPSLATLRDTPPAGSGWVHEIKFDGYRIQARLDRGDVRLLTRKGLDWTGEFPNVAAAVARLPADTALLDGEIVVEDERGMASFPMLQAALKETRRDAFIYYVFDLLHLDGRDLRDLPLIERKTELARTMASMQNGGDAMRLSEHFAEDGALVMREACRMRLEGIVCKRADAPYRPGRGDTFIKVKCSDSQELVVGGYVPSTVLPRAIGALVAGYYLDGRLIYAGRIGTGYTRAVARDLWDRLHPLRTDKPPFDQIPDVERRRRDVQWVEPKTVIESHIRGWTADRLVRQAAFKGVREDKPAREVVREVAGMNKNRAQESPAKSAAANSSPAKLAAKRSTAARTLKHAPRTASPKARADNLTAANENEIRFTHPDRVYWVDVGITKQDLADYYRATWEWMAPHLVNRPLAMVRCPDGTKGECFFQKHASAGLSEQRLRSVTDRNRRQVLAVEDLDGLLSLVQAGVLEVHVRGSTIDRLELCNRIVFDIDPGEEVGWRDVVASAREVRERLAAVDLASFVKLSGGKGLHVVLPIEGADWDATKAFAQAVALAMVTDAPQRYVAKMTKSLRRGKIFVDYLRNSLEATSVAAYSTRARTAAPASVPLTWEELGRTKGGNQYTVLNLPKRLTGLKQDPWADLGRVRQRLPDLRTFRRRA